MRRTILNRPSPRVLRRVRLSKLFSNLSKLQAQIDVSNGLELDRTQDIANQFRGDREGLENYYKEKESSIRTSNSEDSNKAAIDGVKVGELRDWMDIRDKLLYNLEVQKPDAFELADVYSESSDSTESPSENEKRDNSKDNTPSKSFKQDSSDIDSTDLPIDFSDE